MSKHDVGNLGRCSLCGHPNKHHYWDKTAAIRYECYECNSETTLTGRETPCSGGGAIQSAERETR